MADSIVHPHRVAYFSMEAGIDSPMPTYPEEIAQFMRELKVE